MQGLEHRDQMKLKPTRKTLKFLGASLLLTFSFSSIAALTSVQGFQQSLYTVTRNRCLGCHDTSQRPFHASSDVQVAHDQVITNTLVDFTTSTSSKIYLKVKGGHHCWSASCANDANEISNQIINWKALIAVTASTNPATTPVVTPTTGGTTATTPTSSAASTTKMKAYRIYNRLAGVPPVPAVLTEIDNLVKAGKLKDAALRSMDDNNFYNLTLKNWIKPWTNIDKTNRIILNDYVATAIGIIRDNIPFDQILYGDHLYIAGPGTPGTIPVYDKKTNNHYQKLEESRVSLKDYLVRVSQSKTTGIKDTAGVLTTRAAGLAFFSAGTNRRATRFTFMNYLCRDFEALHDINIPDYHVRRDVERNPGGDSRTYRNKCVGCHAGQDALGGAFAYFDFVNGEVVYTEGVVAAKINKNVGYADGWITKDNSWINTWAEGQNSNLGWPSQTSGNGVRELGVMLSRSRAFSECMSTKVYELVCLRTPSSETDKKEMRRLADIFQLDENYNMKNLIAETAATCVEE
jgi:hypothetical protein